jgi:HAD superfamily hydrolase (TIGR01459 family)
MSSIASTSRSGVHVLRSLRGCLEAYDAFIIDLWGVIHDGQHLYDGVIDTLAMLHNAGKKVIFLSNAPRRAARSKANLDRMGINAAYYEALITSGEVAFSWFEEGKMPFAKGARFVNLGPERDDGILDGSGYIRVMDTEEADFLVATGYDHDLSPLDEKDMHLLAGKERNLPLICVNPDIIVVRHSGVEVPCAGIVAERYEKMGGEVSYFGKPYPQVYDACFALFDSMGIHNKARIAAIGDNLHTDIKGAHAIGIDSYLIAGGILATALQVKHGELPDVQALEALCRKENAPLPTGVLPAFV